MLTSDACMLRGFCTSYQLVQNCPWGVPLCPHTHTHIWSNHHLASACFLHTHTPAMYMLCFDCQLHPSWMIFLTRHASYSAGQSMHALFKDGPAQKMGIIYAEQHRLLCTNRHLPSSRPHCKWSLRVGAAGLLLCRHGCYCFVATIARALSLRLLQLGQMGWFRHAITSGVV